MTQAEHHLDERVRQSITDGIANAVMDAIGRDDFDRAKTVTTVKFELTNCIVQSLRCHFRVIDRVRRSHRRRR